MELYSVFVTGANRGIGLEFVRQLINYEPPPKYIFATYRTRQSVQELKKLRDSNEDRTTVILIQMDVTNNSEIKNAKKIVEDMVGDNGLTLLINNAGVAQAQPFPDMTTDYLNLHFSVNTVGPIMVTQAMHPLLKAAAEKKKDLEMSFSRAAVLNITSLAGSIANAGVEFVQDLAVIPYKVSKAGLNMAMKCIGALVKNDGILVIMMCPGWVKTDMGTNAGEIEPHESISAMLTTIAKLNETHQGSYTDRNGKPYPY